MPWAWIVTDWYSFISSRRLCWSCSNLRALVRKKNEFKRKWPFWAAGGALALHIQKKATATPSSTGETRVCELPLSSFLFFTLAICKQHYLFDEQQLSSHPEKHLRNYNFKSKKQNISFILFLFFALSKNYLGRSRNFSVFYIITPALNYPGVLQISHAHI